MSSYGKQYIMADWTRVRDIVNWLSDDEQNKQIYTPTGQRDVESLVGIQCMCLKHGMSLLSDPQQQQAIAVGVLAEYIGIVKNKKKNGQVPIPSTIKSPSQVKDTLNVVFVSQDVSPFKQSSG